MSELADRAGANAESAGELRQGWQARLAGEWSPGGLPLNSTSNALENSRVVKAGSGTLFGFSGFNNKGSAQFVLVFDTDSVPAEGAVPKLVLTVPAAANFSYDGGIHGRAFQRGIVICNSSTAATKTIGSADTWYDCQYV